MRLLGLGPDIGPGAGEGQDVVPACEEGLGAVWSQGQEHCTRVTDREVFTPALLLRQVLPPWAHSPLGCHPAR